MYVCDEKNGTAELLVTYIIEKLEQHAIMVVNIARHGAYLTFFMPVHVSLECLYT
jgi:hypothetical protein